MFENDDKGKFTPSQEFLEHKKNIINFIEKIRAKHDLPASGYVLDFNHKPLLMATNNAKIIEPNATETYLPIVEVEMFVTFFDDNSDLNEIEHEEDMI